MFKKYTRSKKSDFDMVRGRKMGMEDCWAQENVVLILSDRLASSISEWKEVSLRPLWVKVELGIGR